MQVSSGDEEEQLHQEVSLPPRSQMAPGTTATKRRRRLSSSIGNPPLPTLPFDLVLEILYRLPVVAFSSTYHNGVSDVQTHVHTSGTNFWRRIQNCPRNLYKESGKFVGGTLYLLPYDHLSIVSLDLEKESYQELFLPDYRSTYVFRKSLCVLKDCLCILSSHIGCSSEVWLMKEYINSESWTKLFHVPPLIEGVGSVIYERALYVYENDLVLLVVYNSRDGTFKSLKIKKQHGGSKWMIPEVFQESLIYVMLCNMGFRHIKNSSELQL
ncbi:F-box/kelch-repeat protein At3g23880 [Medicago truncatula]|uniref:F-box/kelch-repeat protein At3g23880 n=1 Tax=Medicago truncatula TaxID=3880 RepID=UPI000D2F157F|nr:F-box/kelch-repeat protein At3g23880 [Medicago truncatula]